MRLFHGTDNADIARPTVLTLGVFDGLHLGHQLIMRTVVERARAAGAVPTVITFEPHPRAVLHPESAPPLLQTFDQKIEALSVLGIEQTIGCMRKKFILVAALLSVMGAKATSICCVQSVRVLAFLPKKSRRCACVDAG